MNYQQKCTFALLFTLLFGCGAAQAGKPRKFAKKLAYVHHRKVVAVSPYYHKVKVPTVHWTHGAAHVSRPRLGIRGNVVGGWGMVVQHVDFGSTAHAMGLQPGDVVMKVNGHSITCHRSWSAAMLDAYYHHHGHVILLVDNVAARQGASVGRYVRVHGKLKW